MSTITNVFYSGDYTIDSTLYICRSRLCKVYLPPVIMDGYKYYWIQWLDDKDVSVALDKDLRVATRNERLLYGK